MHGGRQVCIEVGRQAGRYACLQICMEAGRERHGRREAGRQGYEHVTECDEREVESTMYDINSLEKLIMDCDE